MANEPKTLIDIKREEFSHCFGCGKDNPVGLKLNFKWDGKRASAEFTANRLYQGRTDIVHGGILGCILDEAMNYASLFEGVDCVTARMQIRFRRPAPTDEPLIVTASIIKRDKKLVKTEASISLKDGTLIADGTGTLFAVNTTEERPRSNV